MADSIYAKLVEIQRDLHAPKDQYNSFSKFNYRSAEGIIEAVKPLCHERGLFLIIRDELKQIGDRYYVAATAGISDGNEQIHATAYAREPDAKKGYDEAQITGASSSYARKYALNGLFAIDDGKDADTDEHTRQTNQFRQPGNEPDKWGPGTGGGPIEPDPTPNHSNDAAWQINYDDLVKAIEQQVPEIDGHAVVKVMARIKNNNDPDPKHLLAKDLGGMVAFAESDKFVPYYTETITPYLAGEK